MQTFLPYADFNKIASCLDYRRLGKQRIEAKQIYQALKQGKYCLYELDMDNGKGQYIRGDIPKVLGDFQEIRKTPWYNHPIVKMWRGYELCLLVYGIVMCNEWIKRGYKDTTLNYFKEEFKKIAVVHEYKEPPWLGNMKLHNSHRSNLLRKDKKYYKQFGWKVSNKLEYFWTT